MEGYTNGRQFITTEEVFKNPTFELQKTSPRKDHVVLLVKFMEPVNITKAKELINTDIVFQNKDYNVAGIEFFAVANNREFSEYNLLVNEVKDEIQKD